MILINLWNFADARRVKITDVDDNIFEGNVVEITDSDERSDLEPEEDCITIATDKGNIQFENTEILKIDILG